MSEGLTAKLNENMGNAAGENPTEDRICIVREHASGEIAWRFATTKNDPFGLLLWTLFYAAMTESGYRKRIEQLEQQVKELMAIN